MVTHRLRRGGAVGITVVASLLLGALPAYAHDCNGRAYGLRANIEVLGGLLPIPVDTGELALCETLSGDPAAPGGPETNALVPLPIAGILDAGVMECTAKRDNTTGNMTSSANTARVGLPILNDLVGVGGAVKTTCDATPAGVVTTMSIAQANIGGAQIPVNPPENLRIPVTDILGLVQGDAVVNEVIVNPDGSKTVNGVHVYLKGFGVGGAIVIASATCGPATPPIPLASGAGMWIAFGLLGLAAIPVTMTTLRRRRQAAVPA